MQGAKEKYFYRYPERRRQYQKRKYLENPQQKKDYEKRNITKIRGQE